MDLRTLALIDSTLREGEQFAHARFTTDHKIRIASLLDAFGVSYIEVTSPLSSPRAATDCQTIARLGLKAKTLAHVRCRLEDVQRAVDMGVDGVNLVIGTSTWLQRYSHGKSIDDIIQSARNVITWLQSQGIEIRFSTEDTMRSDPRDLYRIYEAVDALGVDRVGVADTVGVGTPNEVAELVAGLRWRLQAGIEFHGHNDTGCAVANAFVAAQAGATHIDTSVLGIGERNGITPLGGFIARLHATNTAYTERYNLPLLKELDQLVADLTGVQIPFNNYITGSCAFSHKAGIHTKAVLNHPSTYECLSPDDFGLQREVLIGHALTGRHAVAHRARQIGLNLSEEQIVQTTAHVKALCDREGDVSSERLDDVLRAKGEVAYVTADHY